MVHGSLIGVPQLIDRELVTVDAPAAVQVAFDGREIGIEIAAAIVGAVEKIQQRVKADDFQSWNKVTFLCAPRGRRHREINITSGTRGRVGRLRQQ